MIWLKKHYNFKVLEPINNLREEYKNRKEITNHDNIKKKIYP